MLLLLVLRFFNIVVLTIDCFYLGRSWTSFVLLEARKSADAIVVAGNEPRKETVEASQSNEPLYTTRTACPA